MYLIRVNFKNRRRAPRHFLCVLFLFLAIAIRPALASLTLTEVTPFSFGVLEIPASGSGSLTVYPDGTGATGSATIIQAASRGQYLIASTETTGTISIDIQNISTGSSALQLEHFNGKYGNQAINSFPVSALPMPGSGEVLALGAELSFTSQVTEQPYSMYFDITVNYE